MQFRDLARAVGGGMGGARRRSATLRVAVLGGCVRPRARTRRSGGIRLSSWSSLSEVIGYCTYPPFFCPPTRSRLLMKINAALGRLLGAVLVLGACLASVCVGPEYPCRGSVALGKQSVTGEFHWTVDGQSGEYVLDGSLQNGKPCWAWLSSGTVSVNDDESWSGNLNQTVQLSCGATHGYVGVDVGIGDPRSWKLGTTVLPCDALQSSLHYENPAADDECEDAGCKSCCATCYAHCLGELTITVEAGAGGPADPPAGVTDDWVRIFRLDFESSPAEMFYSPSNSESCELPLQLSFSLRVVMDAASVERTPVTMCRDAH